MGAKWNRISLAEAGVLLVDCDHRTPPNAHYGYPYIAIPQLRDGRLDLAGVRLISEEHYRDWTRKAKPEYHDVILSRRCNPGETAFVPAGLECALGQNLVLLRATPTSEVVPEFLRWWVRGPAWWEQVGSHINVGAVFNSLKCADIPRFTLTLPPRPAQRAIAQLLEALDRKIELNRQMNATLDAMARSLFKSWFVDFDPVRAKMAGRAPFGMDAATAAAMPATMEESELGVFPTEWRVIPLGDLFDLDKGVSYKGDFLRDDGVPMVNLGCFRGDGVFAVEKLKGYTGENRDRHWVRVGDLVIANTDMTQNRVILGSPALVPSVPGFDRVLFSHHVFAARFREAQVSHLATFAFHTLLQPEFRQRAAGFAIGTTVLALPKDAILALKVGLPPMPLIRAFHEVAKPLRERAMHNEQESRTLAELRDLLLPKLLSGELRIRDAEKAVEAAL